MRLKNVLALFTSGLIGFQFACTQHSTPVEPPPFPAVASNTLAPIAPTLTRVADLSLICMVTDRYFGQPQIPTEFESRTYYGCCEMCAAKLRTQPGVRRGIDPVTGREVDKATAVAGRLADGRVIYFESSDTLARFRP